LLHTDSIKCLISNEQQGKFAGLTPDEPGERLSRDDGDGIVTLPKQLWSSFKENGKDEFVCEVGWVLGHGSAITSRCVLSRDGDVKASISLSLLSFSFFLILLWFQAFNRVHSQEMKYTESRVWFCLQEIVVSRESRVSEGT
jgi:hypothetical protein